MSYYETETKITGDIIENPRCLPFGTGDIANIKCRVTAHGHTEVFNAVAFGKLGTKAMQQVRRGQVARFTGYMKTSPWRDDPTKENHQLILKSFEVIKVHLTSVETPAQPKPQKKQRRQYGRNARKDHQAEIDFRSVTDKKIPEFDDELPEL